MKEGHFYYYANRHPLGEGSRVVVFDGYFGFNTIIHFITGVNVFNYNSLCPYRYGFRVKQLKQLK